MKKSLMIGFTLITVLAIIGVVVFVVGNSKSDRVEVDNPVESTEEPTTTPSIARPSSTSTPEPTVTPPPRKEFNFDDKIEVRITADDYVDTENEEVGDTLTDMEQASAMSVTGYDFSNGFLLVGSERVMPVSTSGTLGTLRLASDEFTATVEELDSIHTTVDDEILKVLDEFGMRMYANLDYVELSRSADVVLGEGWTSWEDPYKGISSSDPTVRGNVQVVVNSVEECAFGETRYLCLYNMEKETFIAHAFITCDRDRLLHVTVKGNVMRLCWSYVVEITNNAIRMIK